MNIKNELRGSIENQQDKSRSTNINPFDIPSTQKTDQDDAIYIEQQSPSVPDSHISIDPPKSQLPINVTQKFSNKKVLPT